MDELTSQDIAAAAAVHQELGPAYSDAVVDTFFEKVDREIGARIDARMAVTPQGGTRPAQPMTAERRSLLTGVAIGMVVAGVPLSLFLIYALMNGGFEGQWKARLLLIWAVLGAVFVAGAIRVRRPTNGR